MVDKWNGEHYKRYQSGQEFSVFDFLGNPSFRGDEVILDIGCGDGRLTAELAENLPQGEVIGIDSSPNMIKAAQKTYEDIPNLSFKLTNATDFHFSEKFDFVYSFKTLHWIENLKPVFNKIAQALKPGGVVVIRMGAKVKSKVLTAFEAVCSRDEWKPYFDGKKERYFPQTAEQVHQYLAASGFEERTAEVVCEVSSPPYNSFDALLQWLMCWMPHCTGLPQGKDLEFSRDIAKHCYHQKKQKFSELIDIEKAHLFIKATLDKR